MKKAVIFGITMAMAVWAHAASSDDPPIRTYCCDDETTGASICADHRLLDVCRGKAYRIVDQNGNVLKRIDAHLSDAERRELKKNADQRRRDEEEAKRQARRDLALLDTYYSEKDIDVVQNRAEKTLRRTIKRATERLEKAQERLTKLQKDTKKYPKNEIPSALQLQLTKAANEVDEEQNLIASKNKELAEIATRYNAERERFRSLIRDAEAFSKVEADKKAMERRRQSDNY